MCPAGRSEMASECRKVPQSARPQVWGSAPRPQECPQVDKVLRFQSSQHAGFGGYMLEKLSLYLEALRMAPPPILDLPRKGPSHPRGARTHSASGIPNPDANVL